MIDCEDCDSRQCLETGVCDKNKPFDFSDAIRTANQSCNFNLARSVKVRSINSKDCSFSRY